MICPNEQPVIHSYLLEAASDWKEFKEDGYRFEDSIDQSIDAENMPFPIAEKIVWEFGLTNALELWEEEMGLKPKVWQLAGQVLYHLLTQEVVEKQIRKKVIYEDEDQYDLVMSLTLE